jgi:ribonuclease E
MKRMLINATQEEELRMAMVDGQRLYDLNIELASSERKKANIYKGTITRLEPSLEAAFVNYGAERHGFLPLKEISAEYFISEVDKSSKPNIKDVLKEGQDIVVQIGKEERSNKGAALTTYISLAGRFIVLKPNKSDSGGISRRILGAERDLARKSFAEIDVPNDMSVILRTAGVDRSVEELAWDLNNLLAVWEAIKKVIVKRPSPFLIYRESNAIIRAFRDYFTDEISEILIDDENTFNEAQKFVEQVMVQNLRKLKHYTDSVPLFTRYQIESQIESAFSRTATLPSGGSLVIDHTEALVSIDINSAKATKGADINTTAVVTNLEAADEIARQLRLRDLGGLIVIDFIDMDPQKNQRAVENRLRDAVRMDRARVQIGKISRFGLLEMSRQRLRPSLGESSYMTCPRCSGIGNIRNVESLALTILRIIGEEARKERTAKVIAQLPVEVATYLLNEKRHWIQNLESSNDTQVIMITNPALETPHYQIRRVRDDQIELPENAGISYTLADIDNEQEIPQTIQDRRITMPAAIATMTPSTPAPKQKNKRSPGAFAWLAGLFSSSSNDHDNEKRQHQGRTRKKPDNRNRSPQRRQSRRSNSEKATTNKKVTQSKQQNKKVSSRHSGSKTQKNKEIRSDVRSEQRSKPSQKKQDDSRKEAHDKTQSDDCKTDKKRRRRGGRHRRQSTEGDTTAVKISNGQKATEPSIDRPKIANQSAPTEQIYTASLTTSAHEPAVVTMIPESGIAEPAENAPANSSGSDNQSPTYADTQPKLPVLDSQMRQPTAISVPEVKIEKETTTPTLDKPPIPYDAKKSIETEVTKLATKTKPEKQVEPRDNAADNEKPEGRLLPWAPSTPTPDPVEQKSAVKDQLKE